MTVQCEDRNVELRVTFDDGNRSDIEIAVPQLVKRNLHGKFFVCTGRLTNAHYLSVADITEMHRAGMEIGSHGRDHVDWRTCTAIELVEEVCQPLAALSMHLGVNLQAIAIPFGSYDRRVLAALRLSRAKVIYSSDEDLPRPGDFLTPRFSVTSDWTEEHVDRMLARRELSLATLRRRLVQAGKRWLPPALRP